MLLVEQVTWYIGSMTPGSIISALWMDQPACSENGQLPTFRFRGSGKDIQARWASTAGAQVIAALNMTGIGRSGNSA